MSPLHRRGRVVTQSFNRLGHSFRAHMLNFIILSLVLNTALAQLFYNSAGVVLPTSDWRARYLVFSAVLSMVAFSLFELYTVRQLKELLGKEKAIRQGLPRWEIPGHILTLAVISVYNIYSLALLNAAIWPDLHLFGIPEFPKPGKYYFHAVMYSLILFLAAVVGDRKKSAAEIASEKDEDLQAEMIAESEAYYRELIRQGGRNVAIARQVLSTPEMASRQQQLLAALEGKDSAALSSNGNASQVVDAEAQEVVASLPFFNGHQPSSW
jgi:hypothetical protein